MSERTWIESYAGMTDSEVLREILLDENGEPRDGVVHLPGSIMFGTDAYLISAEMLEANDE